MEAMLASPTSEARRQSAAAESTKMMEASCWKRFGELCTSPVGRWVIVVVLMAAAVPVALASLPRFDHSAGLVPMMPSDADTTKVINRLQENFGVGSLFPTGLLLVLPEGTNGNATSMSEWRLRTCNALKAIANSTNKDADSGAVPFLNTDFMGDMILFGECTPGGNPLGGGMYNSDHTATTVRISYQVDPFSKVGQDWIIQLRDAASLHSDVGTWYITGEGAIQMDVANETFAALPTMIAAMMCVVLVLIALAFRSVVVPVRAVCCLLWMLIMTFGLAIFTFQDGCFDWLHWGQLGSRSTGAMFWMSPCIAFSILVGLGLDYDIFYTERVVEEREKDPGGSETEAAIRALAYTANTISAAGVIMVIAFMSLLLSSTPCLNEIAFLLIIGILVDCFITTKITIPAGIALLCGKHFWPTKFQHSLPHGHDDTVKQPGSYSGILEESVF